MSIKKTIPYSSGLYFITFTCHGWLPLFEAADAYESVYKWFDHLKKHQHFIVAYVIMPNHVHAMIAFSSIASKAINTVIGNGKRFIAYDIIKKLETRGDLNTLAWLEQDVVKRDREKGRRHHVFIPSFDWKECTSEWFIEQKVRYIHQNPCAGKWNLVDRPEDYLHSSAKFYATGKQGVYEVVNYQAVEDIDLSQSRRMDE
jgi:REP element-mobilizing transposase RayT